MVLCILHSLTTRRNGFLALKITFIDYLYEKRWIFVYTFCYIHHDKLLINYWFKVSLWMFKRQVVPDIQGWIGSSNIEINMYLLFNEQKYLFLILCGRDFHQGLANPPTHYILTNHIKRSSFSCYSGLGKGGVLYCIYIVCDNLFNLLSCTLCL